MDKYFSKFPLVSYNGSNVIDITRKVVIANTSLSNPNIFYPLTLNAGQRSDQVSRKYYGDPYEEWIIWLSNQIIDPYQWYMNSTQFSDFINQKYGSIPLAQQKVKYYQNNWYNNTSQMSISAFIALDTIQQKYFEPVFDGYNNILSYQRIPLETSINTNHMISFIFSNSIPKFINDEIVNISYTSSANGKGQVASVSNTILNIQHLFGTYIPPNNSINATSFTITSNQSNNTLTLANNSLTYTITDTVTLEEDVYYDPIYYYDWEDSLNEANKNIRIMNSGYIGQTSSQISKLLAQ